MTGSNAVEIGADGARIKLEDERHADRIERDRTAYSTCMVEGCNATFADDARLRLHQQSEHGTNFLVYDHEDIQNGLERAEELEREVSQLREFIRWHFGAWNVATVPEHLRDAFKRAFSTNGSVER